MSEQMELFGDPVVTYPYPSPCPIRCNGGCDGRTAWCMAAQVASGRYIELWRWELMSAYEQKCYRNIGAVVL